MKPGGKSTLFLSALLSGLVLLPAGVAGQEALPLAEAFRQGIFQGELKTFYFSETFEGEGLSDSRIWVNGGSLGYQTASWQGLGLGATLQASFIGARDDDDDRFLGSMDAEGAVLSEAFLAYEWQDTSFKGGRQFMKYPLVAGSGSRMIKESFEAYLLTNADLPDTVITAGLVTRYQTRTEQSRYNDNFFVDFKEHGDGDPGDFYDIGDDGMLMLHLVNKSLKNLALQAQYANVFDVLAGCYVDARYVFEEAGLKPFAAGQVYYTDYDGGGRDDNALFGLAAGFKVAGVEFFGGFTSAGGDAGDARVFRGVGQGAYFHFTSTTKTSGAPAFEAGTDSYQAGTALTWGGLAGRFRYTVFDNPVANQDLNEYTFNLLYTFGGRAKGLSASVDFSILDYEDDQKDATDLRTKLIYAF